MMIENIKKQVYKVFDKYNKIYHEKGIMSNIKRWENNKGCLVDLLRQHPNWCEDELSIIFNLTHKREINKADIDLYKYELEALIHESELSEDEQSQCVQSLSAVAYTYSKILPDEGTAFMVKEYSGVSCSAGQKCSRIINAICQKYGLDKHPLYNARFAKLADALNPLYIERTALLSVHPCAYLEMSDQDNSWSSCHCLDDGDYLGGTLSYMNDECSMIFFTVDQDVTKNFYASPKRTRQVFCFHDDMLLQSRLYPDTNDDDTRNMYRNIVQKAISECRGAPNLWNLKRHHDAVQSRIITHEDALHYPDYNFDECKPNVSLLKCTNNAKDEFIFIGYTAYCIKCTEPLFDKGSLYCRSCDDIDHVWCNNCGRRIFDEDARIVNGKVYCDQCLSYCDQCNEYTIEKTVETYGLGNYLIDVCPECLEHYFSQCKDCMSYHPNKRERKFDDGFHCTDCLRKYYFVCKDCNQYISDKEAKKIDGNDYCSNCADKARSKLNCPHSA